MKYKKLWNLLKDEIDSGIKAHDEEKSVSDGLSKSSLAWINGGRYTLAENRHFMDMIQIQESISERFFDEIKRHTMRNTLIVIGCLGAKTAYLNVARTEAIKRFVNANPEYEELVKIPGLVSEFDFVDEFETYDAWGM